MDEQLLREFLAEAEDLIEVLFGDIQALRARHTEGRARRELVGRIFRHAHTIKGSAAAAGLDVIGELAHEFETLLDGVRMGRVAVDASVLEAFEATINAIAAALSAIARGETPILPHTLVEQLRRLAFVGAQQSQPAAQANAAASVLASLPEGIVISLSDYEQHRLREAVSEGARLFLVTVDFDLMTFDEQFRNLSDALGEGGEVISTLPGMEASAPTSVNFRIVYATDEARSEVVERLKPFGASLVEERQGAQGTAAQESRGRHDAGGAGPVGAPSATGRTDLADTDAADAAADADPGAAYDELPPAPSAASLTMLVRVPLDELDDLISATHELFTDTSALLDLALATDLASPERTEIEIRAPRVRRRFVELEERLIELRMVPVRQTLERAARAGQSAARVAGREVDFETVGGEVRLDKSLADAVADPLLHLLRNAVDHGIEPSAERLRLGKTERGHVRLEAIAEGSRVLLRVTDDGRGIELERITRAAVERGLISADERLTEQQGLRLIFRPGFSTASELSTVSGRGVGLDVVEQAVEQAGGELRVWTTRGAGTTFEMRLPTTLALVPSLVVCSAENRYCVDASHIVEAGYVSLADTERVGDAQVVRWRGSLVPLVSLRALLAQPEDERADQERIPVIISRIAGREADAETGAGRSASSLVAAPAGERAAVAVDAWDGHSEVLVRSLGRHATRWRGVSGATELRDGTVALMLDLPRLLEMHL
jgi:two-component system chemotaxis sensor kinase CheA